MEKLTVVTFTKEHIDQAVALYNKWFGDYGAGPEDFTAVFSTRNKYALALVLAGILKGFAVFDILENGTEVQDYKGLVTTAKTAFIQQFTTEANYEVDNWEQDSVLLSALEVFAQQLGCEVVWEALSKDHPFAKESNAKHDAYGFYQAEGYEVLTQSDISWRQTISCNVLSKKLKK